MQNYGLLAEDVHLVANRPCFDSTAVEGLVIDDFFSVSVDEKAIPAQQSRSHQAYMKAQEAYSDFELLGSPEKDVIAQPEGKVIGAYLNGGPLALTHGVCTVGAPAQKRLALSSLTLQACALPYNTVSLHRCIVGAWVSMLLYRRPMMNLLNEAFVLSEQFSAFDEGALVPLSRKVAGELVMCAVLAPLMLSDIAVDFEDNVFATDASESRGAICSSYLGRDLSLMLSKICRTKGAYTRLSRDSNDGRLAPSGADDVDEEAGSCQLLGIQRPIAFSFEFIEVFAGSSRISAALSELGVNVGPPLDISISEEYDLSQVHVLSWLYHLIEEGRLLAIALEPPCTTFSIMRRPALRSKRVPLGFNTRDPKTRLGNLLFLRALQLLKKAALHRIAGLLERPLAAALAWALRHAIKVIKLQREEENGLRVAGLENQFVNEVMLSNSWEVKKSWKFKKPSHINLLELKAVERLVEDRGPSQSRAL